MVALDVDMLVFTNGTVVMLLLTCVIVSLLLTYLQLLNCASASSVLVAPVILSIHYTSISNTNTCAQLCPMRILLWILSL